MRAALVVSIALLVPLPAAAHRLAPSYLELAQAADGVVVVTWRTPALQSGAPALRPRLPETCRSSGSLTRQVERGRLTERWTARCDRLVGQSLGVDGLGKSRTQAIVRVELSDGRVVGGLLDARRSSFAVPARPSRLAVALDYLGLGARHLVLGPDHVLFLLALLLLVRRLGTLLVALSAFTLGHSATLALAALGALSVPQPLAELGIAASLLVLASEIVAPGEAPGGLRRRPWLAAGGFGLLHGLGFAGALTAAGLPAGEVPLALVSFNLGIELGQLSLVPLGLALLWLLRSLGRVGARSVSVAGYAIGSLAGYWCLERALLLP